MSYKRLGLKCGIEIHQQLAGKKLFSYAPTIITDDNSYDFEIKRYLSAAAGESGKVDVAAAAEQLKQKISQCCESEEDKIAKHFTNRSHWNNISITNRCKSRN